jgi:broad specificity phosphatase PhoE
VSHGGTLNAYLAHQLGLPQPRAVSFAFPNTALARLRVHDGRVHFLSLGDDRHLR